jgi:DNA-binding NtrC family response regulator
MADPIDGPAQEWRFALTFWVLIVDDELEVGGELAEAIDLLGGSAVFHSCPESCLAILKKTEQRFDVIIADLAMPAMSGLEFLQEVSRILDPRPKCFLMTGLPEFKGAEIRECDLFQLLPKPVSLRELREKVGHPKSS